MKKEYLYGIIGLLFGIVLTTFTASNAVNSNNQGMINMMGIRYQMPSESTAEQNGHGMGMSSSMNDMMDSLDGKSGEEFDMAFIEAMIAHHQGAIEMAELAKKNAGKAEIRKLADEIISAQTKEINQMMEWSKEWGY